MRGTRTLRVTVAVAIVGGGLVAASVRGAGAASAISPSTLATPPAHVGETYDQALSFSGNPTWSVISGHLPPGLTLFDGVIGGTPTQAGAYGFTVRATSAGATATKAYTILVYPPASSGYDSRVHTEAFDRTVAPSPSDCNQTGDLTYAIAGMWINKDVADANAKLASLKLSHIGGDAPSCDPNGNESQNNLMMSLLIRPYMLYNAASSYLPGVMTTAAANNLVALMWEYASRYSLVSQAANTWNLAGSENHDAQGESFYFLAAQIFSHLPAYRNRKYDDGSTVAQQLKAWHDHWSNYFDERAKRGMFVEVGSPSYHGYTFTAILNIYNFADDPVLRQKAGMVLDLDFADWAQQEFNDVWGGAKSRSYPGSNYDGAADNMTLMATLLFGAPSPAPADDHSLELATSGYYPPPVVAAMVADRAGMGSYSYISRRPGVLGSFDAKPDDWIVNPAPSVLNVAYCTPDYVLGTSELQPGVRHVAPSQQNRWEGIIFNTGSGDRVYPQAGPPDLSPANDAFLSVQHDNVLITAKQNDLNGPTIVYFPKTLTSLVEHKGWIFVQDGSAYLAVRPATGGYHWLTSAKNKAANQSARFIQLTTVSSPIIFEAARAASYSSFVAFQTRIQKNYMNDTNGNLSYISSDGTRLSFFANTAKAPLVNGQPPNYAPSLVFDSPFMHSTFGSGKITVAYAGHTATYDFSHPNTPVKTSN